MQTTGVLLGRRKFNSVFGFFVWLDSKNLKLKKWNWNVDEIDICRQLTMGYTWRVMLVYRETSLFACQTVNLPAPAVAKTSPSNVSTLPVSAALSQC